jgi:glycyl-tRNA synthetase
LAPFLAPYSVAVLPLIKKYHSDKAEEMFTVLSKDFSVTYDESGKIGKRYRRQDAIGTPFVITVDDDSVKHDTFTVRDRDTMEQVTIKKDDLITYIKDKLAY